MAEVGMKKTIHAKNLAQYVPKKQVLQETLASRGRLRHNAVMTNWFSESFLWASLIWSSIAFGYWIYGWKQKAALPLAGGAVMMAASWLLPALPMSLICIVSMFAVYWLTKQGY
jgi:hypothetical protein